MTMTLFRARIKPWSGMDQVLQRLIIYKRNRQNPGVRVEVNKISI